MFPTVPPPKASGRFKGNTLRYLAPWMLAKFGDPALRRAFETLPVELKAGLDVGKPSFGMLASTWYDARIYQHMFDELLAATPKGEYATLARDAGRFVLSQTLRGVYAKLFSLMATPALYARYSQKMWNTHYDTGVVTIRHVEPTVAVHRVDGWAGHHDFVCAINRQSGVIVYEMMGLHDVRIGRERCSPPSCESTYSWAP
jgi:hypothetical protein